jgi:hypothetical protein
MESLKTTSVTTNYNTASAPINLGSSGHQFTIPSSYVTIPKPLSYEFRVVEHVKDGQIVKVGLQYRVWEHDSAGVGVVKQNWTDVVRVQKDVDTGAIQNEEV